MERIKKVPKNWGSLLDIEEKYRPDCYHRKSGLTYLKNIYGRMRRDKPAPTMTTLCTGLGNGRFWHPEQDRALTVREVARIQTFPDNYKFFPNDECKIGKWAKFIGNAVPVRLGEIIAESIEQHLIDCKKK
jgi:DNA (cytosine-5)-methyltransferase 1